MSVRFTAEQACSYFTERFPGDRISSSGRTMLRCPFHDDGTASLSLDLKKGGVWTCHACGVGGGLYDFEKRIFPESSDGERWDRIYKLTGAQPTQSSVSKTLHEGRVVARYRYTDLSGQVLFEKLRRDPKSFTQRAWKDGRWVSSLDSVEKVLYRLPDLMSALTVYVLEGEKDVDAVRHLGIVIDGRPIAATCNFDGAGKWRDEYSAYFAGRHAVIFPDNDDLGRAHANNVARSVLKYAKSVKLITLPGLSDHGDISDFLLTHTKEELLQIVGQEAPYEERSTAAVRMPFFVSPSQILPTGADDIDWLVPGVIHKGGKGMIVAAPKVGKSMIALDLAVALANQEPWLGIGVHRSRCVSIVSREDHAGMTERRLRQIAKGRDLDFEKMGSIFVNTFQQRRDFMIDNDGHLEDLCEALKEKAVDLCIFDVFNKLHSAEDENNAIEMTHIMARFDRVSQRVGCDVAVIHHDSKNGSKKPRGSSAIDSWWDWKVSMALEGGGLNRTISFATKEGQPHEEITVGFYSSETKGALRIDPV